jgi:hypothetical protein
VPGKEHTIGSPLEALRGYAAKNGLEIVEEFTDEGYSGARPPAPDRMRDLAEHRGFEVLLTYCTDRLAQVCLAGLNPGGVRAVRGEGHFPRGWGDQAASFAAEDGRKIEERDLRRAMETSGGKDRPLFQPVHWEDVVLEADVERDLRSLVRLLEDPARAEKMGMTVPTGLMLVGPPEPVT